MLRKWVFGVSLGLWMSGSVIAMATPVPATLPRPDGKPADMTKKVKVYILAGVQGRQGHHCGDQLPALHPLQ